MPTNLGWWARPALREKADELLRRYTRRTIREIKPSARFRHPSNVPAW